MYRKLSYVVLPKFFFRFSSVPFLSRFFRSRKCFFFFYLENSCAFILLSFFQIDLRHFSFKSFSVANISLHSIPFLMLMLGKKKEICAVIGIGMKIMAVNLCGRMSLGAAENAFHFDRMRQHYHFRFLNNSSWT